MRTPPIMGNMGAVEKDNAQEDYSHVDSKIRCISEVRANPGKNIV